MTSRRRSRSNAAPISRYATVSTDTYSCNGDGGQQILVDRYKDIVKSGGENVSSARVEGALLQHHGVARVAVIGIPHDRWGEIVAAVVVPEPGAPPSEDELFAFARERYGTSTSLPNPSRRSMRA